MIKNFTLIAISCLLIAFSSSCTKDQVGGSNQGGTATYSFDGAPGSCATPVVAGIYSIGRQMDVTNTLTFNVNVTVKGTFGMRTTSSNGVYFEGGGTFTTTGPQTLVLYGKGIPVKEGNFPYVPVTSNTCNFTVSFFSGSPAAVFTYGGGTGNCTAPSITGTYATGTALGASNYVDLLVNVSSPGSYTISTATVNGFSFSGSGVFTTGPNQRVRLQGSGTPGTAPTTMFTPSGGCSFTIAVVPPLPPANFTYNCSSVAINGTYTAGTALNATNTIMVDVNVSSPGAYTVTTNTVNGVTFSASGVFSNMGINTITLTSTDTPMSGNTFPYIIAGGCTFNITYATGPPPPADVFKCTINGVMSDFTKNLFVILDQSSSPYAFHVDGDLTTGTDNFSIDLNDDNSAIANGNYPNVLLPPQAKYCSAAYDNGGTLPFGSSFTNANSFTVTITQINTTTMRVIGTFGGTLYDQFGTGTVTRSIVGGTFNVGY